MACRTWESVLGSLWANAIGWKSYIACYMRRDVAEELPVGFADVVPPELWLRLEARQWGSITE
jgi:hypothetical protein